MQLQEVLSAIRSYGSENIKQILMRHGAAEPVYGARVADLKIILKKIKNDQALALKLYDSGVYDAMYLAGLVADGAKMTAAQLKQWAASSKSPGISECTVPWVTAEHPDAWKLGLEWIQSPDENVATSGWNTLAGIISMKETLDIPAIKTLLKRIGKEIHKAPNRVRYTMNGFLIVAGTYIDELHAEVIALAEKIGPVEVFMGETSCKVPAALDYIQNARKRGVKKKKTLKC